MEVGAGAEAELRTQGRPRTCRLRLRAKRVSSSLSPSLSWQLEAGSRIGRASLHGGARLLTSITIAIIVIIVTSNDW